VRCEAVGLQTPASWRPAEPRLLSVEEWGVLEQSEDTSLARAKALGGWLAVYSRPFEHDVVARTAPGPWGPWSRESVLFTVDGEAPYDAVEQADFAVRGGAVPYVDVVEADRSGPVHHRVPDRAGDAGVV